ncbi:unnamed protein product [Cyprideis torosa]|uniref:Uncharacterized protein n=1 Tax=Cyprideis torosa TaxID=163714 RepID=A0A7R8WXQ7_9CRUS|nr:unnamed protein product [Cyprideis torosa]CAG0908831.1 unnamed protein product [Cyprideis torosa]
MQPLTDLPWIWLVVSQSRKATRTNSTNRSNPSGRHLRLKPSSD